MPTLVGARAYATATFAVSTASVALLTNFFTQAQLDLADVAVIEPIAGAVRYLETGGAATNDNSYLIPDNTRVEISPRVNIQNLRLIRESGETGDITTRVTLKRF